MTLLEMITWEATSSTAIFWLVFISYFEGLQLSLEQSQLYSVLQNSLNLHFLL